MLWAALGLGLNILMDSWVLQNIKIQRAQNIESLVHSHAEALILNDTRAIRDEFLRQNVLSDDRGFDQLHLSRRDDQLKIQSVLRQCRFITAQTCAGTSQALIFNVPAALKTDHASFAILLETPYFHEVQGSLVWKILGLFGIAVTLGFVAWAIRQQEKFLLEKIALLSSGLQKVESFFTPETPLNLGKSSSQKADEFELISESIEQAASLLEIKTKQIEEFKRQFENKTRIDQLAQTIAYSSHNLKAPLQEGAEFLRDLPRCLETMPKETLLRAARSLEIRFKKGNESLEKALNATKESAFHPEKLNVTQLLGSFKERVALNPNLKPVKIEVASGNDRDDVYCNPADMDAVFWNLINNSVEAKRDSQISLTSTIENNEVVVHFRDNGPGIPDPMLEMVFDDFFTTKNRGTGLGLASVRRMIEKSRGKIAALPSSEGAHFEIRLPLIDSNCGEAPRA